MSPNEQNEAIAKALGWTPQQANWPSFGYPPGKEYPAEPEPLPDFYNDLNAMAIARSELTTGEAIRFAQELSVILAQERNAITALEIHFGQNYDHKCGAIYTFINATAKQQSEAWLRSRGLWVD